jgi:hypothetical protein
MESLQKSARMGQLGDLVSKGSTKLLMNIAPSK